MGKEFLSDEEGRAKAERLIFESSRYMSPRIVAFRRELLRRAGGNEYISWFDQAIYDDKKNASQVMIQARNCFVENMWERRFPWVMEYVIKLPDPYAEAARKNWDALLEKYLASSPVPNASRKLIRESGSI